jgi:hypothetical protein
VNGIDEVVRSGGTLTGGRIRIRSAGVISGKPQIRADYAVDVAVDEEPLMITRPGERPQTLATAVSDEHSVVFVRWQSGSWRVVEVTAK